MAAVNTAWPCCPGRKARVGSLRRQVRRVYKAASRGLCDLPEGVHVYGIITLEVRLRGEWGGGCPVVR